MLKKIKILNFQSHADTELDLSPGVNCIIGQSNQGKTAVLRSLYWLIDNRPLGDSFVSHWSGKKGKTSVCVETTAGTIEREKVPGFNGYRIDGAELAAVGSDVPEAVEQFLNIGTVNVQRQIDRNNPFLLSQTPGEIARFFNSITRLDDVDKYLSAADGKKRQTSRELKDTQAEIDDLQKRVKKYDILPEIEKQIVEYEQFEADLIADQTTKNELLRSISEFEKHRSAAERSGRLVSLRMDVVSLEAVVVELSDVVGVLSALRGRLSEYSEYQETISAARKISGLSDLVGQFEIAVADYTEYQSDISARRKSVDEYERQQKAATEFRSQITTSKAQLPEMCPVCGGKL